MKKSQLGGSILLFIIGAIVIGAATELNSTLNSSSLDVNLTINVSVNETVNESTSLNDTNSILNDSNLTNESNETQSILPDLPEVNETPEINENGNETTINETTSELNYTQTNSSENLSIRNSSIVSTEVIGNLTYQTLANGTVWVFNTSDLIVSANETNNTVEINTTISKREITIHAGTINDIFSNNRTFNLKVIGINTEYGYAIISIDNGPDISVRSGENYTVNGIPIEISRVSLKIFKGVPEGNLNLLINEVRSE